jgi:hypothetical protein
VFRALGDRGWSADALWIPGVAAVFLRRQRHARPLFAGHPAPYHERT